MTAVESLQAVIQQVAAAIGAAPRAVECLAAVVLALAVGTVSRITVQRLHPTPQSPVLLASLKTWWVLIAVLLLAASFGRTGVVLALAALSAVALAEFLRLLPDEWVPRPVAVAAFLFVPAQYAAIWLDGWKGLDLDGAFLVVVPLGSLAALSAVRMASAPPRGFLASLGAVQLGVALSVFGLSHAACFHALPASSNPAGGALGWLLFLLIVTETNDMAQAFCGRLFGRHKATPHLSPNKTWEGFVGGAAAAATLAIVLAPWITPLAQAPPRWRGAPLAGLPFLPAVAAGMIIAIGGIVGDLTLSACKRDRGVKDFGTLLPGHGGVLDRFDSLTITAPLFYHFVRLLDY